MIHVFLPSQLESYTDGVRDLKLDFDKELTITLQDVVAKLDTLYKGMAFRLVDEQGRIRRHIAFFVGENMARTLDVKIDQNARVQIVGALSGG